MFPKPYDLKNKTVNKSLIKIGEMVVLMGFLESWIESWIWNLIDQRDQNIGKKITSPLMYRQKVDLLLSLVESRSPDRVENFQKIHKKLQALGERRNNLIHSQYFLMYGNKKEHLKRDSKKVSLRHGVNKKDGSIDISKVFSDVKLSELTLIINDIRKYHTALTKFFILQN